MLKPSLRFTATTVMHGLVIMNPQVPEYLTKCRLVVGLAIESLLLLTVRKSA